MRKIEQKKSEATHTSVVEMKCDLCGKTVPSGYWDARDYEVSETEVKLKEGTGYPEGGSGTEITIDICPECFKTKLVPWVESQGGQPAKSDVRRW